MKICVTATDSSLDSDIDYRFGRSPYFLIVDEKGKLLEASPNPGFEARGGAGVSAAQFVADKKVDFILTGNVGPNAFSLLRQTGTKIFSVPYNTYNISVQEAIRMFNQGELREIISFSSPGRGREGRGRRFGFSRR